MTGRSAKDLFKQHSKYHATHPTATKQLYSPLMIYPIARVPVMDELDGPSNLIQNLILRRHIVEKLSLRKHSGE